MKKFKLVPILLLFCCSCLNKNQILSKKQLLEFKDYSLCYYKRTILISTMKNSINNCGSTIVYYSNSKVDSISNKLIDNNELCKTDTLKIKLLAQKFIDLYPKYKVTNLIYFNGHEISFGYSNPKKPEYLKVFNDSVTFRESTIFLDEYNKLENGWYKLK